MADSHREDRVLPIPTGSVALTYNYSNLFSDPFPAFNTKRSALVRELQIQLIIKALGGDGTEQGLVPVDSIREKAMRLLYALEEAAK